MKALRTFAIAVLSPALAACIACWSVTWWVSPTFGLIAGIATSLVASLAVGAFLATRVQQLLEAVKQFTIDPQAAVPDEFSDQVKPLRDVGQRWLQMVQATRDQSRDIAQMMHEFGVPASREGAIPGVRTLRALLAQLASSTDANLQQMLNSTREIEQSTRDIATGAEDQNEAVSRTTTYAEQMSSNIDTITGHASAARHAVLETRQSSEEALRIVQQLSQGMTRIRGYVDASGRKLQALGEHSNTISSIVSTIGAISSRTDMLALNAAIESVRAGEHGRGFAFVAEEVRKLAEQAAHAAQEVATLVESIRLETQESISVMSEEQAEIETELARVQDAANAMDQIYRVSNDSAERVQEITQATQQQLQLIRDLVLAVERISKVARTNRNRAENAQWSTRALTKAAQFVDASIAPLRNPLDRAQGSRISNEPEFASDDRHRELVSVDS